MTWQNCTQQTKVSKIKLEDAGSRRSATFVNAARKPHAKTAADGCWIQNSICADWVLTCVTSNRQAIVELKGKDVNHAVAQILATAERLRDEGTIGQQIAGLVVCTQYPGNDTKIQRARLEFARKFKGPIHAVTKSREFELEKVVDFKGPG